MNREDIIRMAREVGGADISINGWTSWVGTGTTEFLERFAALVASAEREKALRLWMLLDDIDTADDIAKSDDKLYRRICQNHQKKRWHILSGDEVDEAIRARGKKV